ncbi:MAG: lipopolysaccharide heptosyltransferase II [Syntrophobacterales bacterium]|nr:lipopolysaccharide heptosyltransferase II [Syntrophobacterales bacterium]
MAKSIDFDKITKVLIRGTNWIGDVVMTFPAIAAVRETLPAARVTVLVKPWVADLVRMHPAVDEVLVYERPGRHEGAGGILRLARELKARRFDAAILLQNAIEAAIIARLAGIPVRAGYSTDARGLLLTHPVRLEAGIKAVHQSLYYVEMLEALGFTPSRAPLALTPTDAQRIAAEQHLVRFGIAGRRPIVGMAPGAAYGPAKRWFADRFAAVADRLAERFSCPVLLFGSQGDRPSTEAVRSAAKTAIVDVAGRTNLGDAVALIARCDLFITNDSGLMHVAGALGVPTVAIFGSTNPKTTYPLGERTVLVRRPVDCSPCLKQECPADFRCMDLVTVDEVLEHSTRLLGEEGYRRGSP